MTNPTSKRRPGPGKRVSGAIYDAAGNSVTVDAHLSAAAYEAVKQLQQETDEPLAGAFRSLIFKGATALGFSDSVSAIDALAAANGGTTDARAVHHLVRLGAGLDPILINPPTP
jgi:hypothetical protein